MISLRIPALLAVIALTFPLVSVAADYQKGEDAYFNGDFATAMRELKPLAEGGDPFAQNIVGDMYHYGEGVPENLAEAAKWYRSAAEQGLPPAQSTLGYFYEEGLGVSKNLKTAVKWYRAGAEQGHAPSQFNLGVMYALGRGVDQDDVTALMWTLLAARQGEKDAIENADILRTRMSAAEIDAAEARAEKWTKEAGQ